MKLIARVLIEDPFRSNLGRFILDLRRLLLLRGFRCSSGAPLVHAHEEADHQHRPDHDQECEFSHGLSWRAGSLIDGDNPELVFLVCRLLLFHHALPQRSRRLTPDTVTPLAGGTPVIS